jgi:hypothetical protein
VNANQLQIEYAAVALIEAVQRRDMPGAAALTIGRSRDELVALATTLAWYVDTVAADAQFDLGEWLTGWRQRLLKLEADGDDGTPGVA